MTFSKLYYIFKSNHNTFFVQNYLESFSYKSFILRAQKHLFLQKHIKKIQLPSLIEKSVCNDWLTMSAAIIL